MVITDFISNYVFLVGIVIIILFFIIRYLYSKGYFDKFGIKDIKLTDPTNNDFFKTDDTIKGLSNEDFFGSSPKDKTIGDNSYFDTKLNPEDIRNNDTKTKKWFEEKKWLIKKKYKNV